MPEDQNSNQTPPSGNQSGGQQAGQGEQQQQQSGGQQQQQEKQQTPPWGSDKDFDPAKAWKLIENLRSDKDKLTADRDQFKSKVDEAERAKMTEQQRIEADRDTHKMRADKAERDLLRMNTGLAKGLTAAQSRRLVGNTKAELEADADAMIDEIGGTAPPPPATRRPRENLRGGSEPDTEPDELDPSKLAAKIPR